MYVNVREKMKEWGVEAEKGEGIKEEEKQRQYDEMIELRRQQRKKIQSKGADCTNLKEYQQEVIKIRYFLQITMVILITVLLIWTGLSAEEGERIPILILEFLIDAPLLFFSSKVVTLSKEGCKISYLFFKKMYKWEELEIIREDYFPKFPRQEKQRDCFLQKKKIKQAIVESAEELGMTIENLDETRSRRDYNRYVIAYDSVIPMASDALKAAVFVGNVLYGSILSDCFIACP